MARYNRVAQRWLGLMVCAGLLLVGAGCHVVEPPDPAVVQMNQTCREIPCAFRQHVYVIMINGLDVVDCCDMSGLLDTIHGLGFTKTYYGRFCHAGHFHDEMCRIHQEDAQARFVVIGSGLGAEFAHKLAVEAAHDGMAVDACITFYGLCASKCSKQDLQPIHTTGDGAGKEAAQPVADGRKTMIFQNGCQVETPAKVPTQQIIDLVLLQSVANVVARDPQAAQATAPTAGEGRDNEWAFLRTKSQWPANLKLAMPSPTVTESFSFPKVTPSPVMTEVYFFPTSSSNLDRSSRGNP